MRVFWELSTLSFQRQLAYRSAHLAGLVANFFFGLLRAAVLVALYGAREEVAGFTVTMAITFTGLSQAMIGHLSLFSWSDVMRSIYSGEIANDLLKPMGFFSYWLAQDAGRAFAAFLMRSLTIMFAYAIFFDISYPNKIESWAALLVAILLSWLVSFSWRFLVNLAAFWTPNAIGIARLLFGFSWILSGFFMPLNYFPDWFQHLAYATPFPSMVFTVIEVYLENLTGVELFQALMGQVLWFLILFVLILIVLRAGIRQLVVQGG
jgi:ABC-2 type transport system permease protein